jgi:hypothetical protein
LNVSLTLIRDRTSIGVIPGAKRKSKFAALSLQTFARRSQHGSAPKGLGEGGSSRENGEPDHGAPRSCASLGPWVALFCRATGWRCRALPAGCAGRGRRSRQAFAISQCSRLAGPIGGSLLSRSWCHKEARARSPLGNSSSGRWHSSSAMPRAARTVRRRAHQPGDHPRQLVGWCPRWARRGRTCATCR